MARNLTKIPVISTVLLLAFAVSACERREPAPETNAEPSETTSLADIPRDQRRTGWTERERYVVELEPRPNPIPFQELFEFHVRVWEDEDRTTPVDGASVDSFRARMPAHDHGMKTSPEISDAETDPGSFVIRGVRFHMQGLGEDGRWTTKLVVDGPDGIDRATFEFQCCRPDG